MASAIWRKEVLIERLFRGVGLATRVRVRVDVIVRTGEERGQPVRRHACALRRFANALGKVDPRFVREAKTPRVGEGVVIDVALDELAEVPAAVPARHQVGQRRDEGDACLVRGFGGRAREVGGDHVEGLPKCWSKDAWIRGGERLVLCCTRPCRICQCPTASRICAAGCPTAVSVPLPHTVSGATAAPPRAEGGRAEQTRRD